MIDAVCTGLHPSAVISHLFVVKKLKKGCNLMGWLIVDAVSMRLELLNLEGLGFSQSEIVKELSQNCVYMEFTRIIRKMMI